MALTAFPNVGGVVVAAIPFQPGYSATSATAAVDAVGESFTMIGTVKWTSGPGTSKSCSSAGSKIHVRINSLTFANAGTNMRIGIQDVSGGFEDGTFDVYADKVGGSGGLVANLNAVTMTTGSKTIAHGDLIAVVFEMTARGGTDAVTFFRYGTTAMLFPYCTHDTGSGPAKISLAGLITLEADDGTLGYFNSDVFAFNPTNSSAFGASSTPDEYALLFQVPVPMRVTSLLTLISSFAITDDFELILYSDPLGTPVAERTITVDADQTAANAAASLAHFERDISPYDLAASTTYAVAIRPTTANTVVIPMLDFGSNAALRAVTLFGTDASLGTRTNQTGAFSQTTTQIPLLGFRASHLEAGGGGGGAVQRSYAFIG